MQARFLPDLLQEAAQTYADRTAIDFFDRMISYKSLWQKVQNLAVGLQKSGLQKGDRVGLMLPNTPAYIEYYFATLLAGGVVVNINPLYAPHELQHIIDDSDPKFVVTLDLCVLADKLQPVLGQRQLILCAMRKQLPKIKGLAFRLLKHKESCKFPDTAIDGDVLAIQDAAQLQRVTCDLDNDVAVLQYTGGTTGTSKAAMLSHANLSINAQQCRLWFAPAQEGAEKALAVIPFFHAFALTSLVNLSVMMGTTIIALPRFDPKQVMRVIAKKKPTIFPAVPTVFATIANHPQRIHYDLDSIKYCISGGAPLPLEVKNNFEQATGCILVEGYGLSEASPVVCANPLDGENKSGTIGKPMAWTSAKRLSLEDGVTEVSGDEKGELCVKGPQIMLGYWRRPDETEKVLKDGWLRTGDVAVCDKDGYYTIVDRIKDMILCGGYNVYPRNIEEAVYRHASVEECVCAGLPDPVRGEVIKIWIKLKQGHDLTEETLKGHLQNYLSPIEMPRFIELRDQPLPKTLIGKLSRKQLLSEEKDKM